MLTNKKTNAFLLFLILSLMLAGCTSDKTPNEPILVKQDQLVLGTFGSISVYSNSEEEGNAIIDKAYDRIREIENLMSTSIENSDVYNMNKNAGVKPVNIDPSTAEVILEGFEYYSITKEAFNIGLGSLIELWGIGKDWQKVPTSEEIAEAQKHIDLNQLEISKENGTAFIKDPNMLVDLGGIAKGYSVDEAIRILKENGIKSGIVNLGGDVYALGTKIDGTPWRIGVSNPEIGESNSIARIATSDKSVVSSGDYERYFIENEVRYHHIIDPKTGYPTDNDIVSVTIVSDTSRDGDVLSTAIFILGLDEGLKLIESLPGVEGILILNNRQVYVSSGLSTEVEILDDDFKIVN